ncbi:MAG: Pyruvate,phosphate dikinase [uncultured Rubrobacteraceae bacterium]|uniref:Pyruvate, phosphate dikinase n=1 Tax=uncultured Rubrobacteraceae bacterium TaxID=349277 RepID=A0A6J4QR12_9ACTN|nr:MAG: Pyruvate,phosphate dikinase [uncultured Rubrobacteraceae bacterium]
MISHEEALLRVDAASLPDLLHPRVDPEANVRTLARGFAASTGAAVGEIVLDAGEAREKKEAGEPAVLVAEALGSSDKEGMLAAAAVVTGPDGLSSHDLVLLRGAGTPVVFGCEGMEVDAQSGEIRFGEGKVAAGEVVTVDGSGGRILCGEAPVLGPATGEDLEELLSWADGVRTLFVRANADTAEDAARARKFGAEGVGLCRTERMFMKGGCLGAVRRMILAERGSEEEAEAISDLEKGQREDFEELFRAMSGLPVAVRLLDPPLHEFLPGSEDLSERLAASETSEEADDLRRTLETVGALAEATPMLGTRGVRLGLLRPEIYRMQARAVAAAVGSVRREGHEPIVEILVPLVQFPEELKRMKKILREELKDEDILIGATIEAPRACFAAHALALEAPFFSFGTNDLTQTTLGISRDDAKSGFLPEYLKENILEEDPFERVDEEGVGRLMKMARNLGREANPDLALGVCGEHGGEPQSIRFFQEIGIDYVSCSPYRVPVARLAAAQAAIGRPLPGVDGTATS